MRIAIVALTDFRTFPIGGIRTFVRRFVQAVGQLEDLEVALIGWCPAAESNSSARRVRVGPREHDFLAVGKGRLHGLLPDRMQFYIGRRWGRALGEAGTVDAYYCHTPEASLRVARLGCGAPIAMHIHGATNVIGKSRFALGRTRLVSAAYEAMVLGPAMRASQAIFATVSNPEFHRLKHGGLVDNKAICVRVPAMVNESRMASLEHRRSSLLRLVCVGRLEQIKGVELVIETVAKLASRGVPCELRIIGDGTERPWLERFATRLGIGQQVEFAGRMNEEGVQLALSDADVFVSGSYQEGFSLALLEALAQGLPAVVTDVGSARDVVQNGRTGYVVDTRDPATFAERVLACAANASAMRARCIEAAEPYSSSAVSRTILETLSHIAGRHAPVARGQNGSSHSVPNLVGTP